MAAVVEYLLTNRAGLTNRCFVLLIAMFSDVPYTCSKVLNFYLFADDTNILYADKNLKSPCP